VSVKLELNILNNLNKCIYHGGNSQHKWYSIVYLDSMCYRIIDNFFAQHIEQWITWSTMASTDTSTVEYSLVQSQSSVLARTSKQFHALSDSLSLSTATTSTATGSATNFTVVLLE